jgi:uncharacterized membrane protein YdjX (TVP38/TMEM64 family)
MTETVAPSRFKRLLRFAPLIAIGVALVLAVTLGLHKYLSIDAIRAQRDALDAFVTEHRVLAIGAFMLALAFASMVPLPGAVLSLMVASGFLFGLWGAAASWAAACLGGTALFVAARSALRELLHRHVSGWLGRFEEGFRANAFNYILALRLFPGAPFFVVNLAPAFFDVKLRDFVLATLIGAAPVTLIYASVGVGLRAALNAGVSVDPAQAVADLIFSLEVLAPMMGLTLLSLLPVLAKRMRRQ